MPAGSQISGEDGIITLLETDDSAIGEVPCLTNWTLNSSANLNERISRCMKSNGDGGSDSDAGWTKTTVESRSWDVSLDFFYQEDQTIPASVKLDPTNVGQKIKVQLYPNDNSVDKVVYEGVARIETAPISSEVNGDVNLSVTLKGDGPLSKAIVTV